MAKATTTSRSKLSDEQVEVLIKENMPLILRLAQSFCPRTADDLEEMIQIGRIAVWNAAEKFDSSRAKKLSTLMWRYIRWDIIRYLEKEKRQYMQTSDFVCCPPDDKKHQGMWEILPSNLTEEEAEVIRLRALHNCTFKEIGKQMGYGRNWANRKYQSALRKIGVANK